VPYVFSFIKKNGFFGDIGGMIRYPFQALGYYHQMQTVTDHMWRLYHNVRQFALNALVQVVDLGIL
jgi:hypothetical protein